MKSASANTETRFLKRLIIFLILLIEMCPDVHGGLNFSENSQEDLFIRNVRHHRRASKSKAKVLGASEFGIYVKFPEFSKCEQLGKSPYVLKEYPDGGAMSVSEGNLETCVYLGGHKFYFTKLDGKSSKNRREGVLLMRKEGHMVPFVVLYFHMPPGDRGYPPILWHAIGSNGPGWVDLRFKINDELPYKQYLTFWLNYRKRRKNTLNDLEDDTWYGTKALDYIDFRYDTLTVLPTVACPEWADKEIYCVMLADYIRPEPGGNSPYTDYEFTVYAVLIVPWSTEYYVNRKYPPQKYHGVVRVWQTCDPTSSCPKYLMPLGAVQPHPEISDLSIQNVTSLPDEEYGDPNVLRKNPRKIPPKFVRVMRMLWPLFLLLFLLTLLLVLPCCYLCIKRRAMQKRMKNWYAGATPSGFVNYSIALPCYVRIPSEGAQRSQEQRGRGQGRERSRSSPR